MVLFDPTSQVTPELGGAVQLAEARVHQQAVYDHLTGDVYVTQVIDGGKQLPGEPAPVSGTDRSRRGDLTINRVSATGQLLGVMYCLGFDHGGAIAIDHDTAGTWLWTAYDAAEAPEGANGHGRRIARFPFQDGAVLRVGDPSVQAFNPFPAARAVLPSIDPVRSQIAVNYAIAGEQRRYRIWDLATFKTQAYDTFAYDIPWENTEEFQSFTLYDGYIYQTHGRGYSEQNPPPGDAFFAIIDITTGRTIRIADNEHFPQLQHREPEALTVKHDANLQNPQLVFGFATGPVGARRMNLYATGVNAGPGTWISSSLVEGQGVLITASLQDRAGLRSWQIVRRPDGATLFTGSSAEFPQGVAEFLDTAPPPCVPVRYELQLDYETRQQTLTTRPLTYLPPGGCGGTGGPVTDVPNTLSCAEAYIARIHWRGGALVKPMELMDQVTEVAWSRTLNDVSTATVTLSRGVGPDCCREIEDVHDWVHELSIYRVVRGTPELVWQGPIQVITIKRDTIEIEAADVFAWLDKLVNTYRVTYNTLNPINGNRRIGTIVYIAYNHIRLNLEHSSLSVPPDYPGIMDYIVAREDGLPVIRVEKDGSDNKAIWTEYLGNILREWTKRGLTWTTVGRALVLRGFPNQQTLPIARFNLGDLLGDVEIIRDGTNTATYGFATNQNEQNITDGMTVGWGYTGTAYGRLDSLVEVQDDGGGDEDNPAETVNMLRDAAKNEIAGRYPTPLVIQVPDNSQISPEAPITLDKLVPGERFDVFGEDFCIDIAQGFALSDVEGKWEGGRERISVSLVPLDDLQDGDDTNPDDPTAP